MSRSNFIPYKDIYYLNKLLDILDIDIWYTPKETDM